MIEKDGSIKSSNIIQITSANKKPVLNFYPSPDHGFTRLETPGVKSHPELILIDSSGKLQKTFFIGKNTP